MIWWSRGLVDLALTLYLWAAAAAVWELGRGRPGPVSPRILVPAAWLLHTGGLVLRGVAGGAPPVGGLHAALSLVVWGAVTLALWGERRPGLHALAAFVLPPAAALGLMAAAVPEAAVFRSAGVRAAAGHGLLVALGLGALAAASAAALMYLFQEQAVRQGRLAGVSRRLPPLLALDRFAAQSLLVGVPALTAGLLLGALAGALVHGPGWLWQPTPVVAGLTWAVYAGALGVRGARSWGGRRAAYLAVVGFVGLVLTLGVSLLLPLRHVGL